LMPHPMPAETISSSPCPAIPFAQAAIRAMSPWLDVLERCPPESRINAARLAHSHTIGNPDSTPPESALNIQQIEPISPQGIVGGLQWKELSQSCSTVPPLPVAAADCTASNSPI